VQLRLEQVGGYFVLLLLAFVDLLVMADCHLAIRLAKQYRYLSNLFEEQLQLPCFDRSQN
jgi:hypothetical protein